jgi:hypothetical protein
MLTITTVRIKILMENVKKPNIKELVGMIDEMNKNIEGLPPHALILPINHYDFSALLILLKAIFEAMLDDAEA